jgi:hypothetical protein
MNNWLAVRAFIAFYLAILGVGLMFGQQDERLMVGALLVTIGVTFLLRMVVELRQR